ncbi:hypothetical protein KY285_023431 [Solanum tuberosum]|nr:hypothetical protein KY285_023431 [Solanum tuberosum]
MLWSGINATRSSMICICKNEGQKIGNQKRKLGCPVDEVYLCNVRLKEGGDSTRESRTFTATVAGLAPSFSGLHSPCESPPLVQGKDSWPSITLYLMYSPLDGRIQAIQEESQQFPNPNEVIPPESNEQVLDVRSIDSISMNLEKRVESWNKCIPRILGIPDATVSDSDLEGRVPTLKH